MGDLIEQGYTRKFFHSLRIRGLTTTSPVDSAKKETKILVREHFTQKMTEVKQKVLTMGDLVDNIIDSAVTSIQTQDLELARKVNEQDDEIDQLEMEIEKECIMLLALQQPLAKDLRTIASVLKIITDLERMGDNAVNIAKVTLEIGKDQSFNPLLTFQRWHRSQKNAEDES